MGHPKGFAKVALGSEAHVSDSGWSAPRLSIALRDAPAGHTDDYRTKLEKAINANQRAKVALTDATTFDGDLKALLEHLSERLMGSLDEAWMSPQGYDVPDFDKVLAAAKASNKSATEISQLKEYSDWADTAFFWDSPEERWARAFCERVVYSMYHSIGQAYGYFGSDGPVLSAFPRVYSISLACQNLSTYCILSRGVPLDPELKTPVGVGCGCTSGCVDNKAFVTKKKKPMNVRSSKTNPADQQAELKTFGDAGRNLGPSDFGTAKDLTQAGVTPGSVVVFNGGGIDYNSQDVTAGITHIASVLRVSGARVQFVDTGVVIGNDGETSAETGTVDHSFQTGQLPQALSAISLGVLRDCKDTLADFAKKTSECKPLGLTRLVIARGDKKQVLFASKLLHMRWPVSQHIWSLRNLPTTGLTLAWLVYVTHTKSWTETLIQSLSGAAAAPSGLFTGSGEIKLANVIISGDGNNPNLHVYRAHKFQDWRVDTSGAQPATPGEIATWKIDAGSGPQSLLDWSVKPQNFGKRFLWTPDQTSQGQGKGGVDEAATGNALVDP